MSDEDILIAMGWPPDEAYCMCRELRSDGQLHDFMALQLHKILGKREDGGDE